MTIYIAGPMTGLPNFNYDAFNAKAAELRAQGHKVLNPAEIPEQPKYDMYWPIDLAMLRGADAIYLLEGWEKSKGALMEFVYAVDNRLELLFEIESDRFKILAAYERAV